MLYEGPKGLLGLLRRSGAVNARMGVVCPFLVLSARFCFLYNELIGAKQIIFLSFPIRLDIFC